MKWSEWIEKWGMESLRINAGFLELEWKPSDHDKNAAWDLYVELLTRSATQGMTGEHGDEKAALDSIYALFPLTRQTLKANTHHCKEFTKIAVIVLNQIVRPFTTKWHQPALKNAFANPQECKKFRSDLHTLQIKLRKYTKMLADMAGVEDLTELDVETPE